MDGVGIHRRRGGAGGGRGEAGSLVCRLVATPARAEGGKLNSLWGGAERSRFSGVGARAGWPAAELVRLAQAHRRHLRWRARGVVATLYLVSPGNQKLHGISPAEVSGSRQVGSSIPSHSECLPRSTRTTRTRCLRLHARRRRHRSCRVPTSRSLLRWQRRRTLRRR